MKRADGAGRMRRGEARVAERLGALDAAVAAAEGRVPADLLSAARNLLDRAGQRRRLAAGYTVVALVGATGSGKSSLFNAMTGMDVARVGVRRPTTAEPLACVWGDGAAAPLLDWLSVPRRSRLDHASVLDSEQQDELDGLVLLDLPDYDSTSTEHRAIVDRMVELVDVFVWVTDPQKYADAALHDRYLRQFSAHEAVTVVVLNQTDRLTAEQVDACEQDLRRLLAEDGLSGVPVLPVSARLGTGVDRLLAFVATAVSEQRAADDRIGADVTATVDRLAGAVGREEPGQPDRESRRRLVEAVFDASGARGLAAAVGRSYLRRGRLATGWVPLRWLARLRRDPLGRLGLTVRDDEVPGDEASRLVLPETTPAQRARSTVAVREFADAVAGSLPMGWRDVVRSSAEGSAERLPGALAEAVSSAALTPRRAARWWSLANAVQWLAAGVVVVALGWLLALAGAAFLRFDVPSPEVAGIAAPTLLLLCGVGLGVVVAAICGPLVRRGGRRASARVTRTLRAVVERTVDDVVVAPVDAELDRYREFQRALAAAHA